MQSDTGGFRREHVKDPRRWRILETAGFERDRSTTRFTDLAACMPTTQTTEINQLLRPEHVRIGLSGTSKSEVINALVDVLEGHEDIDSLKAVRKAIFDREEMMSTGVGKGLGLPHAKTAAATDTVAAFATTEEPVDFGAIDDEPIRLLLLLVGPEEHKSKHIKILGRISRLVSRDSLRRGLIEATDPETVIELLRQGEAELRA